MAVTQRDLDLMAWTLLGEAGGEGARGMQAVANVIVNRARSGQYPSSIGKVVLQPKQFSTWNKGEGGNNPTQYSKNSDAFQRARAIAEAAVNGQLPDITGGALNYWAPRGMKGGKDPAWARGVPESDRLRIGNHVFLTQHPVPPAPLTAEIAPVEAPLPATMSPELAFASKRNSALEAIEQLASGNPANEGIASAYTAPTAPALPMPPVDNWSDFYASVGIMPPKPDPASFTPGEQNLPPPDMYNGVDLAAVRESLARNKALEQTPFASDDALKRLASTKDPSLLLQSPQAAAAASYDPMAALAPAKGQNILDELASSGPYSIAPAKPRLSLAEIMGRSPAAGTQRTAATINVRPDGTETAATRAGSNEQPMPGRPSSVPPAPPLSPLLGGPTPAARTSLGEMMGTVRPVTGLVTPPPAPGSVPGLTGFGATPVGGGMPSAPMPSLAPPVPAQRPQEPVVNSKGFFLGNPFGDYQVKKGETLGKIAKKFGTTVDNLATVNNIPDPAKIKAGARLVVTNPSVAPVTPAPRPASRTSSSSSSSSTPVYTPPKQTVTSATKASIPVYSSASITPAKPATSTPKATTPTGGTITQAQMNAIRGLKEGGPVGYAYGGYIPGGTNVPVPGPQYSQDAQRMADALKTVDVASRVIPYVSSANFIASSFAPKETWEAKGAIANQMALAGTAAARNKSTGSTPMMDGSPSSSRPSTRAKDEQGKDADKGKSGSSSSSSSSGGIDGVIGTYNPPTQAQIDALYAPYFRQAAMPGAGYNPGVSGEFNYFPQATAAPAPGTGTGTGTPAPAASKAVEWFNTFASNMGDRSKREEARKVMADAKTSFYDLFRRYRNSLGRKANPTLEGWQTYLSGKGYAKGGAVSSEPRLVLGQGGPTGDKIPARIDNKTEARLSNGEFVMTAAAVRGLGGGDYARGAEALMRLNDQFDPRHNKGTLKVEKVR